MKIRSVCVTIGNGGICCDWRWAGGYAAKVISFVSSLQRFMPQWYSIQGWYDDFEINKASKNASLENPKNIKSNTRKSKWH